MAPPARGLPRLTRQGTGLRQHASKGTTMNSGQNPRLPGQRFDTLGGADPNESEDELAVPGAGEPGMNGPDILGGPDAGPEDELAVPGAEAPPATLDDADAGEGPE